MRKRTSEVWSIVCRSQAWMVVACATALLSVGGLTVDAACQGAPEDTSGAAASEMTEAEEAGAGGLQVGEDGRTTAGSGTVTGMAAGDTVDAGTSMGTGRTWELDRIAAIVNNSLILQSEVEEQTFLFARQQGVSLADTAALAAARREVLGRLIEEKVIVDEARKRGMTVTREDIETAVDGVLMDMRRATGSEDAFQGELQREGLTEEGLREIYRPRLEAQILASRLVRREVVTDGEVSDAEIEKYYEENQEKFPERPESVRLSHIYFSVVPDSTTFLRTLEKAEEIRARVLAGEDFAALAAEYSADPSAASGGDLGYFTRGQLDPFFENAVFSLAPGEVGEVVQSRLGFHVIKLTEMRGDTARASHILVPVAPTSEDMQRALDKASRVKVALDAGEDFTTLAATESEDPETKDIGGDLGYFALDDLAEGIREAALALAVGEISDVVQAPDGYHIFLKTDHRPRGRYTLEETKEEIHEFIRNDKLQAGYERWIEELKKDAYIDIKGS